MVRFTFDLNLPYFMKQAISDALHEMEASSNVRFYNATGQPTVDPTYGFPYPYINFVYEPTKDVSYSDALGRVGGKQEIHLADFAASQDGAIIHEICHALGMRHEQTRIDRDSHVNVNHSNLTSDGEDQFQIPSTNYYQMGAYDSNSVMGYGSFTSNQSLVNDTGEPMYTKLDGSYITQGSQLSTLDDKWIDKFYIPYIARSDTYSELDDTVYNPDGTVMTEQERLDLQAQLNNGDPTPPDCCRLENNF